MRIRNNGFTYLWIDPGHFGEGIIHSVSIEGFSESRVIPVLSRNPAISGNFLVDKDKIVLTDCYGTDHTFHLENVEPEWWQLFHDSATHKETLKKVPDWLAELSVKKEKSKFVH